MPVSSDINQRLSRKHESKLLPQPNIFSLCATRHRMPSFLFVLLSPQGIRLQKPFPVFALNWVSTQLWCLWKYQVVPVHLWEQRNPCLTPSYRSIAQGIPTSTPNSVILQVDSFPRVILHQVDSLSLVFVHFNGYFTMVSLYTTSTRTRYCEQHHSVF